METLPDLGKISPYIEDAWYLHTKLTYPPCAIYVVHISSFLSVSKSHLIVPQSNQRTLEKHDAYNEYLWLNWISYSAVSGDRRNEIAVTQIFCTQAAPPLEQDNVTLLCISRSWGCSGSHMRQWVSPPACVRQISTERGQSDQRCLQPKSSNKKRFPFIWMKSSKYWPFYTTPKSSKYPASIFRCEFYLCSSLWWFAWAEPKNSPSQLGCMPPRVSHMSVECLESRIMWVSWDSSSTAIQVNQPLCFYERDVFSWNGCRESCDRSGALFCNSVS